MMAGSNGLMLKRYAKLENKFQLMKQLKHNKNTNNIITSIFRKLYL